jgi:hypothetical protein
MAAELGGDGGGKHKGGKPKGKKQSTRIDFTPMVDLGFLLFTFFILPSLLILCSHPSLLLSPLLTLPLCLSQHLFSPPSSVGFLVFLFTLLELLLTSDSLLPLEGWQVTVLIINIVAF